MGRSLHEKIMVSEKSLWQSECLGLQFQVGSTVQVYSGIDWKLITCVHMIWFGLMGSGGWFGCNSRDGIGRLPQSHDLDLGFTPRAKTHTLYYRLSVRMVS